jgi:hypothetical protein
MEKRRVFSLGALYLQSSFMKRVVGLTVAIFKK